MFERYTESARRCLFFSRYEASQVGSLSIETEHLLLGLIRERGPILAVLPADPERLRRDTEARLAVQEQISTSVEIPFSPATKRVLQFAANEADALHHEHIGSEHLLLGLLRAEGSGAAEVLIAHGARLSDARQAVANLTAPVEASAQATARMMGDEIKRLAAALAESTPGSQEAAGHLQSLNANVDALLRAHGIR